MNMWTEASNIILAAGGVIGSMISVATLGWWLSGRFVISEDKQQTQLDRHEEKDQERHDQNLERFRVISVALARLGYTNGVSIPKGTRTRK
jgi:hypothetical protein